MKFGMICLLILNIAAVADPATPQGMASWYGDEHRGKLMANGKPFDPDKLTAASWDYPLGSKVLVRDSRGDMVTVLITDRGPAKRLVRQGRIIDLSRAAFECLAPAELGLIHVTVQDVSPQRPGEAARVKSVE